MNRCKFDVVTIHDQFNCHPNNMNQLRRVYLDVLMEIADSDLLADILSQITGEEIEIEKTVNNLSSYIDMADYAIC